MTTAAYQRTIAALPVDDHQFATSLAVQEILELVIAGRAFLPKAKNDPVIQRRVAQLSPLHDKIQRNLEGRKLSNARGDLKRYLREEWIDPDGGGVLPPFLLWFAEPLVVRPLAGCVPLLEAVIPPATKALLLDGESRLEAALYLVEEGDEDEVTQLLAKRVGVMVFHGIDVDVAAKYFADINGKGVGVNPNLLVSRDFNDPYAKAALAVFEKLGLKLEADKRQVSLRSPAVVTAFQARTMVAAMVHGPSAVSFGATVIPSLYADKVHGEKEVDFAHLTVAAANWLGQVFEHYGAESFKDKEKVLRSVPVLVSLGAVGRGFYTGDQDEQSRAYSLLADNSVDWAIGNHWAGIAGKTSAAGTFSVGSGKENVGATYRALTDPEDPGYRRIRHSASEPAAQAD